MENSISQLANSTDLLLVSPVMVLLLTGIALMLMEAFKVRTALPIVAGIGFLASILLAVPSVLEGVVGVDELPLSAFSGMMRVDKFSSWIHILLTISGLMTLFFLRDFMKRQVAQIYDVYALLAFALVGMDLLANGHDLIMIFIGLETMSICLYIMAGMYKKDVKSNEAGLKYFLLGAFATGFFLYGIALIYGAGGSTNLGEIDFMALAKSPLFYPGFGLLLIGFLFKVAAFPFHAWTPDVYTGTPTPLAGFMATGSKMAAFVSLGIFASMAINYDQDGRFQTVLIVVAVITMIFGNVVAARQRNLKRMLAYSSIAHSGYVLLAVAAGTLEGMNAMVFYMFVYMIMNIGAFGLVSMVETKAGDVSMDSWRGFGRKNALLGAALTVFLLSLAGIPPLAGFMGKYMVFKAVISADLILPAIIGILSSVVGAYYYINVIKLMYFDEKAQPSIVATKAFAPLVAIVFLVLDIFFFGIFPNFFSQITPF